MFFAASHIKNRTIILVDGNTKPSFLKIVDCLIIYRLVSVYDFHLSFSSLFVVSLKLPPSCLSSVSFLNFTLITFVPYLYRNRINTPGVIERVKNLFRGYNKLILGFNTFLPEGEGKKIYG